MNLRDWEKEIESKFNSIHSVNRIKCGGLLPIIPKKEKWDEFIVSLKTDWHLYRTKPFCLLALFAGIAFFEYDERRFWPEFQKRLGLREFTPKIRDEISKEYKHFVEKFKLVFLRKNRENEFVSTAVFHIGIPILYWADFLRICEWAYSYKEWASLSDELWLDKIKGLFPNLTRLQNFVISNRETATNIINELLSAKSRVQNNPETTIDTIAESCILLRDDLFDEIPEIADFLKPKAPDSLLRNRAWLRWDDNRSCITLQLPSISYEFLPAKWEISHLSQNIEDERSDEIVIDALSFTTPLILNLKTDNIVRKSQRIQGILAWGLFDLEQNCRLINPKREVLPYHNYLMVSKEKISVQMIKGFDEDSLSVNEPICLQDGSTCFYTRLWPNSQRGLLSFKIGNELVNINFHSKQKIEAYFFVGKGYLAAAYDKRSLKLENLPLLCLSIPLGFLEKTQETLTNKFYVLIDDKPWQGTWVKGHEDEETEFFFWQWSKKPVKSLQQQRLSSFKELNPIDFEEPNLRGLRTIAIKAPDYCLSLNCQVEIIKPIVGMDDSWKNLPGLYLLWFLLDQPFGEKTWDNLIIAKNAIDMTGMSLAGLWLHRYADCGLLEKKGNSWEIKESRAVIEEKIDNCCFSYCGKPSRLWSMYRFLHSRAFGKPLPVIEVAYEKGSLPFLKMHCAKKQLENIKSYLSKNIDLKIVHDIWKG